MSIERTSILNMSHEDWLEERRRGIGGSDAAGIVGLNAYMTPYSIWADKTGRIPPKEDNEAMRQGRDFEDYVAKRWEEVTGKKVRRCNYILRNTKYPFAHANIDRDVVGENAGLECKTTSLMNLRKFKNGSFPENYYAQCMHYLAVTGADKWYLAVLVLNQGFYNFVIERDEAREKTPIIGYAGYYKLINGTEKTIYMTKKQVEAHERKHRKGQYMGKGWRDDFDAMALKTVYRKLIGKWGLMSIDYRTADKETVALATAIAEDGSDNIIDLDVDGFTVEEEVTANE